MARMRWMSAALGVAWLAACTVPSRIATHPTDEEYEVYGVVARYCSGPNVVPLVADEILGGPGRDDRETARKFHRLVPGLAAETMQNLLEKASLVPGRLQRRGLIKDGIVVISAERYAGDVSLSRFRAEHPGASGFLFFSRVGFDLSGTQAAVYVEDARERRHALNSTCVLLAREGSAWRVVGRHRVDIDP